MSAVRSTTIRSVMVAGIRGVRTPRTLELDGRSILVRGDNGTGKSSLVQAMQLALTGSATSRSARPLADEFLRHRLELDEDAMRVTIELSPKGRLEMIGGELTANTDAVGRALHDACRRSLPFLRRDELLNVVNAEGVPRMKYFEGFLDLRKVDDLAAGLAERAKLLTDRVRQVERERAGRLREAQSVLHAGAPLSSADEVEACVLARARALNLELGPMPGWPEVRDAVKSAAGQAVGSQATQRRPQLLVAFERVKALAPPEHPKTVLGPLRAAEKKAHDAQLLGLLTEALQLVKDAPDLDRCPVCEQEVVRKSLAKRLKERLAALGELEELEGQAEALAEEWEGFLCALEELEELVLGEAAANEERAAGRELLEELEAQGRELSKTVLARLKTVRVAASEQLRKTPDDRTADALTQLGNAVLVIDATLGPLRAVEAALKRDQEALRKYKAADKALGDARKDVVTEILCDISSLVADFYAAIHPSDAGDEITGAPSIVVHRHGHGVAKLRGVFNGEEVDDPRDVYSDGHLDTVGICIFLALRRSQADRDGVRDARIMVLDDIIMSIDMGHAERLLGVLRDRFGDHQIILVSHNELFMKQAARVLSAAKRVNIARWSLHDGPRLTPHKSQVDDLREKLESCGDAPALAIAMGPVLDQLLHDACLGLAVKVPFGCDDLTIREYWDPLRKKIRALTKDGALPDCEDVFAAVGDPEFFRNALGAHYNEWALAAAALAPVQRVAKGLLSLMDRLSCGRCKNLVRLVDRRDPSAGFACQCPRGAAPELSCQKVTSSRVEGA